MHPADEIILRHAQMDFEEGLVFLRERLRANTAHPTLVAKAMEGGILAAIATLQLRPRYREDVRFLLSLAHRVHAGEDAATLARENLHRALRMRELALVARVKEPEFARVESLALSVFEARLPDLARMVAVREASDYDHLVRAAFPDARYVEEMIVENQETMLELVAHVEAHPRIARIPASWVPSLAQMSRDMIGWETERVLAAVRRIFSGAPVPAPHPGVAGE